MCDSDQIIIQHQERELDDLRSRLALAEKVAEAARAMRDTLANWHKTMHPYDQWLALDAALRAYDREGG
jgi:hypothetical protein